MTGDTRDILVGTTSQIIEYAQINEVDLVGHRGLRTQVSLSGSKTQKLVNLTRILCTIIS
jgi:hypothetical protein